MKVISLTGETGRSRRAARSKAKAKAKAEAGAEHMAPPSGALYDPAADRTEGVESGDRSDCPV
jgi:hypothetical protein